MTVNPNDKQEAGSGTYPSYTPAVLPGDIAPYNCDHDNFVCRCAHDWRINWGNMPKVQKGRNVYVSS